MLRILLVILVALAVIIGLMTISGGKSGVNATGASDPASVGQPSTSVDADAASVTLEADSSTDSVADVYAEDPAGAAVEGGAEEALPDDLSEGEMPVTAEEAAEEVPSDPEEAAAPNN